MISIHIPKTAGTSWRLMIEANCGRQASFVSVESRDREEAASQAIGLLDAGCEAEARTLIQASGCQLIHGHRADAFLKLFPDAPAIIWLRDPMERLLSEYAHLKTFMRQENKLWQAIHSGSAGLDDLARVHGDIYTRLVARLDNHPGGYVAMLTERSGQAEQAVNAALGWRGHLPRRNIAPGAARSGHDALIDRPGAKTDSLLASDREIYETWSQRWLSGEASERAQDLLRAGPRRGPPQLRNQLRRLAGVWKEKLGRSLGRDWR
ncbi:sulfotransferase family 2 domain-containing protein [Maricaulis sp.]|uniref:sulfotransferase family 2 domain-containing protein n=1 Tax=Maricaulis sp. TaxID=1486257 RepID=UPI003A90030D